MPPVKRLTTILLILLGMAAPAWGYDGMVRQDVGDGTPDAVTTFADGMWLIGTATTPVTWTDLVGVTATPGTNDLNKPAVNGWGNGGAASNETLASGADGCVRWTPAPPGANALVGFSATNADASFNTIQNAIDATGSNFLPFENGVAPYASVPYATGDQFRVCRRFTTPGTVAAFDYDRKPSGGSWATEYTTTGYTDANHIGVLIADAAIFENGNVVTAVSIIAPATIPGVVTFDGEDTGDATSDWYFEGFRSYEITSGTGAVKYQYYLGTGKTSNDCTGGAWSGTWLAESDFKAVGSQLNNACTQIKAQIDSGASGVAKVGQVHLPYSPFDLQPELLDTCLVAASPANNYGSSTSCDVKWDNTATKADGYLIKVPTYTVPRPTLSAATFTFEVTAVTGAPFTLELYELVDGVNTAGNYWREGTKAGAAGSNGEPTWNNRRVCISSCAAHDGETWVGGSTGADTSVSDHLATPVGSVSITGTGTFTVTGLESSLRTFRDSGENRGYILKVRSSDRTADRTATINTAEAVANRPTLALTYAFDATEPDTALFFADDGLGSGANFQTANQHNVSDAGGDKLFAYATELARSQFFRYDGFLFEQLGSNSTSLAVGHLLVDPAGYIHHIVQGAGNVAQHYRSVNPNDARTFTLLSSFGTAVLSDKGTFALDPATDDIFGFLSHTSSGAGIEFWKGTTAGVWTLQSEVVANGPVNAMGRRTPWYPNQHIDGQSIYLTWLYDSANASDPYGPVTPGTYYTKVCAAYSVDGGANWLHADGTAATLPIQYYECSKVIPNLSSGVQSHVSPSALTKVGSDILITSWVYHDGGTVSVTDHTTNLNTDNDLAFGGGTGILAVGQTYTATAADIGRITVRLRNDGAPTQTLLMTVTSGDDVTSIHNDLRREPVQNLLTASDLTGTLAEYTFDFPALTGDARFQIITLPEYAPLSNGSFEVDTAGWASSGVFVNPGSTLSRSTVQSHTGAASMLVDTAATGPFQGATFPLTGSWLTGNSYEFSLYVRELTTTGEVVTFNVGINGGDTCSATVALSPSWQKLSCSLTPTADITSVSVAIRRNNDVNVDFYVDTVVPSEAPADRFIISTDGVGTDEYTGGTCRTHDGTSWTSCAANDDLNFTLRERTVPADLRTSEIRKWTPGVGVADVASQPPGERGDDVFLVTGTGLIFNCMFPGNGDGNGHCAQSTDNGETWSNDKMVTTFADPPNRTPFYPSVPRISTGTSYMTLEVGLSDYTPGTGGEVSDVAGVTITLVPSIYPHASINFNPPIRGYTP